MIQSNGGIVARLVSVTCGWFPLVQELNNKPLGFVCVHRAAIKGVWV